MEEACRSLPDFDIQNEEEPEQRIAKLKDYAQHSHIEIKKLKAEHEAQIAELQLRIIPEIQLEVREQHRAYILASTAKILDIVGSVAKLLEESVDAWTTLQENPEVQKLQETIKK